MTTPFDILGLGASTVDELLLLPTFPRINTKVRVLSRSYQCGGLTGTALVAASRQGSRCGFLITLGTGQLSAFTRRELGREHVELCEGDGFPEAEPYHSLILIEKESGERSVLSDNSRIKPPPLGPVEREMAYNARCLFVDHIFAEHIIDVVTECRRRGVAVVGDFERTTPRSRELMDIVNHLILPLQYAREALGVDDMTAEEAACSLARVPGRSLACVTNGAEGSWYAESAEPERVRHQPAFSVERVVDSTGCGDVFHGVYAACLVSGFPAKERIRRAAAAAAIKTQKPGAQAGAPTRRELEEFLAARQNSH